MNRDAIAALRTIFIIIVVIGLFITLAWWVSPPNHEVSYEGSIIDRGYDPPTSGHKSTTEAVYWVILKDEAASSPVRIHVTAPTYYTCPIGSHHSFTLTESDLHDYGNTSDYKHFKSFKK